jgi:hypothetical protein
VLRLINRWRAFWKDLNGETVWKFPEVCPEELLNSFEFVCSVVNLGEWVRAKWMWSRKPRPTLGEGGLVYALFVFVAVLLLLVPHVGPVLTISWCVAMLGVIARDIVRSIRWRREYEVSINRIVRGYRNFK